MKKLLPLCLVLAMVPLGAARASVPGSRVIVSTTLNSTLQFFDASTLAETQPPLPSKGLAPVRMWVQNFAGHDYLLAANHGIEGSLGVFDLSGDLVTELGASPFPAGAGSVGVSAGYLHFDGSAVSTPMAFVTNTTQALGGCGMPEGSVTAFDASLLPTAGVVRPVATLTATGPIPYAVGVDGARNHIFASSNCGNEVVSLHATTSALTNQADGIVKDGSTSAGSGPDGVVVDEARAEVYVAGISSSELIALPSESLSASSGKVNVSLPGAHPIDITLADSPGGHHWVITSNGGDDSVSLVDRDRIDVCRISAMALCAAETLRIPTGVAGGAPEGVAYDPASNRIFVVNKPIPDPSLTVIQLDESGTAVTGKAIANIPLPALGATAPQIPSLIAFDVVVQQR